MKKPVEAQRKAPVGKMVAVALAALLLIVGSVWGVRESIESRREAANLAEVQKLREQFKPEIFKEMEPEQRKEFFKEYKEKSKKLTFSQRKKLMQDRLSKDQQRYDDYFNAPEDQREAVLAKQMEEGKKRWKGGGPGGDGRGGRGGKGSNQANNTGGAPGAGNGDQAEDEQAKKNREMRKREYLDMTTPDQRAQKSVYRQAMRDMRQQQQGGGR